MNTNTNYHKNTFIYSPYELLDEYVEKFIYSAKEFDFASEDYLASNKSFIYLGKKRDSLKTSLQDVINKLDVVQRHAKTTFKTTKRLMAGKTPNEIATLYGELGQIHSIFNDIVNKMKYLKSYESNKNGVQNQTKIIDEKMWLASKALLKMSEALKSSESKLQSEDGNTQTNPPIPRFDKWIAEQTKTDSTKEEIYQDLYRIIQNYFLKNNTLSKADIVFLQQVIKRTYEFGKLNAPLKVDKSQMEEFRAFLQNVIDDIKLTIHRKKALLKELNDEIKNRQNLTEQEILKYTILYRQFMMNPFDIPVSVDTDFVCEPFRNMIEHLPRINYSQQTLEYKTEGLKKIRAYYEKNKDLYPKHNILISGAGPSGLILALVCAMRAQGFQIIETRSSSDPMRSNIIALGKEGISSRLKTLGALEPTGPYSHDDIKILDFFGITDLLDLEYKALYDIGTGLNVTIMDLQKAALEQINEISKDEEDRISRPFIYYNTEIGAITRQNENDPVLIKLKTSPRVGAGSGFEGAIEPTLVYVTEGYHSATRKLLGINVVKQTKPTRFAFSLLEKATPSPGHSKKLDQSITSLNISLRGTAAAINFFVHHKIEKENISFAQRRGELNLKTFESTYFYTTLTPEEQKDRAKLDRDLKIVENERNELELSLHNYLINNKELIIEKDKLGDLIGKLSTKDRRKKWRQDKNEVEQFFQNAFEIVRGLPAKEEKANELIRLKELNSKIGVLNQTISEPIKQMTVVGKSKWDLIDSWDLKERPNFTPMKLIQTQMAYAQIQTIPNNYRRLEQTLFCITGDAECTTDPLSGAGMRTSILRTVSASELGSTQSNKNGFMASAFQWSSQLASKRMREEGLHIRTYYQPGTERLERYTEIAKEINVISEKEERFLLRMQTKAKMMQSDPRLNFTRQQQESLNALQNTLRETYLKSISSDRALIKFLPSKAIEIFRSNLVSPNSRDPRSKQWIAGLKNGNKSTYDGLISRLKLYYNPPSLERKSVVRLAKIVAADPKLEDGKNYKIFKKTIEATLFKMPTELCFNAEESEIFKKAWKTAVLKEENTFFDEELTILASVNSKVASYFYSSDPLKNHASEAWFIPLFFAMEKMKKHL